MYSVRAGVGILLGLCLVLGGCGGDGKPEADPGDPTPGELHVEATYQSHVKQLDDAWAASIVAIDDQQLRFAGDPELAVGEVFVVRDKAYKVVSVNAGADESVLALTAPALEELFSSLVISGRAELGAANFTLDPAVAAASVRADADKDNSGPNVGWVLQASNYIVDGWKTAKITGSSRTIDDGASVRGTFSVGGRFETDAGGWDPIFDRGAAVLEVVMAPDLLLYLEKDANYPKSDEVCSTAGFGGGHGRIRIGTLSVPTNLAAVRIDLPFCASIESEVSGALEVLKLSGTVETRVELEGSSLPTIKPPTNGLVAAAPGSDAARIPDGPYLTTAQPSTLKEVAVSGTFALEQSLELSAHGRVHMGAAQSATSIFSYSGSAAASAVDRHFDIEERSPSPEVCIHVTSTTSLECAPFKWERHDLEVTTRSREVECARVQTTSTDYGTCGCENGDETTACTGGGDDVPVARDVTLEGPADTAQQGQLDATGAETYEIVIHPSNGTVSVDAATGAFTYAPATGYVGTDWFTYVAINAAGSSQPGYVTVTVIATGPQPKTLRTYKNRSTFAAAGSAGLTFSPVTQPAHGELVQNGSTWYYEPEPDYVGEDSYSYSGSGPDPIMVLVTVEPTCELPVVTTTSDARTTMTSRFGSTGGTPVMHSWPRIETKFDWDADPQRCHFEITAASDYAGVADLWIKLPEKPEQSTTYNATSWYRPSTGQAFVRFSNYSTTDTGTISATREGEDVIIQATDLLLDGDTAGYTLTVSFTVVGR